MTDDIVKILLRDHTTGKNIIWATSERSTQEILPSDAENIVPRWQKNRFEQKNRTRARAEIFTPPEVCEIQNKTVDKAWLRSFIVPWIKETCNINENSLVYKEYLEAFLEKIIEAWYWQVGISDKKPNIDSIVSAWLGQNENLWKNYIDMKFLEITCGEAPYITSRYNAFNGNGIKIANRVGILDKKLKIIDNKTETFSEWKDFAICALQSVYGYEFQGDNLFLARRNIFDSVVENFTEKFSDKLPENLLLQVADVISWNFWQMDGIKYTIPYANSNRQMEFNFSDKPTNQQGEIFCKIKDWKTKETKTFENLIGGARK